MTEARLAQIERLAADRSDVITELIAEVRRFQAIVQEGGDDASEHARALSRRGASKGGVARTAALTPERRQEIAIAAAQAR